VWTNNQMYSARAWVACVLLAVVHGCSSSNSDPVAPAPTPGGIPPLTITIENPVPASVTPLGLACLGGGNLALCSSVGFAAVYQNGVWRRLDTGTDSVLEAAWGTSASNVYFVGENGCFLHWDGVAVRVISSGVFDHLNAVWGTSSSDVWACGGASVVHWNGSFVTIYGPLDLPLPGQYQSVGGSAPNDVYVVGMEGVVMHFDGAAWTGVTTGLGNTRLNSVFVAGNELFIGGDNLALWHFDGAAWSAFTATGGAADDFEILAGTGAGNVFAFGDNRLMHHWNGSAWSDASDPFFVPSVDFGAACALGGSVVVGNRYDYTTTNLAAFDGSSWAALGSSSVEVFDLRDVWTFDENRAVAVGDGGVIIERNRGGWSDVVHGLTGDDLHGVWASSPSDIYAVGNQGVVLHNNGTAWSVVNTGLGTASLYAVAGSGANDVWVAGITVMWHWNGATWTEYRDALPTTFGEYVAIYVTPGGDVYAGGNDLLHFDGTTWTGIPIKFGATKVVDMWGTSGSNIWMAGTSGFLHWNGTGFEFYGVGYDNEATAITGGGAAGVLGITLDGIARLGAGGGALLPFAAGERINGAGTGSDGTTYLVGGTATVVRVEPR